MAHVYHTLVVAGLWRYMLAWAVGYLMGTLVMGKLLRAIRTHLATQTGHLDVIADRLDTSTPGGLQEVVAATEQIGSQHGSSP